MWNFYLIINSYCRGASFQLGGSFFRDDSRSYFQNFTDRIFYRGGSPSCGSGENKKRLRFLKRLKTVTGELNRFYFCSGFSPFCKPFIALFQTVVFCFQRCQLLFPSSDLYRLRSFLLYSVCPWIQASFVAHSHMQALNFTVSSLFSLSKNLYLAHYA